MLFLKCETRALSAARLWLSDDTGLYEIDVCLSKFTWKTVYLLHYYKSFFSLFPLFILLGKLFINCVTGYQN